MFRKLWRRNDDDLSPKNMDVTIKIHNSCYLISYKIFSCNNSCQMFRQQGICLAYLNETKCSKLLIKVVCIFELCTVLL